LQKSITRIIEGRGVSEEVIKGAIEYLDSITRGAVRYTDLTLYLEKHGLKRESIARRVIDMWRKNTSMGEGGCPIGEQESDENPIYPYVDNMKYNMICYLKKRW
jgi:hypothetical protein